MWIRNFWKMRKKEKEHQEIAEQLDEIEKRTRELDRTMRRLEIDSEAFLQRLKKQGLRGAR